MSADIFVAVVTDSQTVEVGELPGQDTVLAVVTDSQTVDVVASTASVQVDVATEGVRGPQVMLIDADDVIGVDVPAPPSGTLIFRRLP